MIGVSINGTSTKDILSKKKELKLSPIFAKINSVGVFDNSLQIKNSVKSFIIFSNIMSIFSFLLSSKNFLLIKSNV